ncbi:hypothetical protein HZH68_006830 [Vespula germanica]|uniref:Uncharacterized protein n=1 Tax=Vespula germanica TaxID=30212 RepID=A0A834KE23_VESGE|nr:hypothetical protein HZH68_006830 [Vespula germanica]
MSYLEVARFGVPPLRTSCDPNTKLGLREKFPRCQEFEFVTGEYELPGGGTFRRATSSHIMLELSSDDKIFYEGYFYLYSFDQEFTSNLKIQLFLKEEKSSLEIVTTELT